MIIINNIEKKYDDKLVLNNISLQIQDGEAVALVGKNGSGKSTLAEIIAKSLDSDQGQVSFFNNSKEYNPSIGFQFQTDSWPYEAKVKDLIFLYCKKKVFQSEELHELKEIFAIDELLDQKIRVLSGGEKQRLNCFLTVINKPEILIFDELFNGLDLKMQFYIINYIKEKVKAQNNILILISHNPEEIALICNRIVFLKSGEVIKDINIKKDVLEKNLTVRQVMEDFFEEDKNEKNQFII